MSDLLTVREVLQRIGSKDTDKVYALIASGELVAINVSTGRRATWRFEPSEVEAFLQRRRVGAVPPLPSRPKNLPVPSKSFLRRTVVSAHG